MNVVFDPVLAPVLRSVGRAAVEAGAEAWAVGGVVRDAMLGRSTRDVDITATGDALRLVGALERMWQTEAARHDAFGTATLSLPAGLVVDIARARSEAYARPGALPTVAPAGLEADLRRRDFTVNAMAASLSPDRFGRVRDPLGGADDLQDGVLRTLHPESFRDDPTRLFRAARMAVRYALEPDANTEETARKAVSDGGLETISADRRRREVDLLCAEPLWAEMAEWLNRWSLWDALGDWRAHAASLRRADVVLAWARRHGVEPLPSPAAFRFLSLLAQAGEALWPALAVRPAEARLVESARVIVDMLLEPDDAAWRRQMDAQRVEAALLALTLARTDGHKRRLTEYLARVRPVRLSVSGADLLAAGARPGPAVGAALRETLDAVREGRIVGRDAELAFALRVYHAREGRPAAHEIC